MKRGTIVSALATGSGRISPADPQTSALVSFTDTVFEADWAQAIVGQPVDFDQAGGSNVATRVVLAQD